MARNNKLMLHREAGYMNATGFQNQSRYLANGAGSIHEPQKLDSQMKVNWTRRWAYRRIGHGTTSELQF